MRRVRAFTIIELLIALSLSSFIIMGMMQGQRNVMRFVRSARNMMLINRKVCLLFNQFERDMTTAIIPTISKHIKMDKSALKKGNEDKKEVEKEKTEEKEKPEEKGKKKKTEREKNKIYFMSRFYEDQTARINKEKFELFKDATWICTNPLQVYGQKKVRLVRVGYELKKDKQKSKPNKIVYKLVRKETTDLSNFEFKEAEVGSERSKKMIIRKHLVADNVKGAYLKCEKPVEKKKDGQGERAGDADDDEEKVFTTFEWSKEKQTMGVVPQAVYLHIIFYDEDLKKEYSFKCYTPILSFPTKVKEEKKDEKDDAAKESKGKEEDEPSKKKDKK